MLDILSNAHLGPVALDRPEGRLEYKIVTVEEDQTDGGAIPELLKLSREAGILLPKNELERVGIDPSVKPELRWLAYVLERLRGGNSSFVRGKAIEGNGFDQMYDELYQPFLASTEIIEMALLPEYPRTNAKEAGENISLGEQWKPGKWFETLYGISSNTLARAGIDGRLIIRKNKQGTRNQYSVSEVRSLWPEQFDSPNDEKQ